MLCNKSAKQDKRENHTFRNYLFKIWRN